MWVRSGARSEGEEWGGEWGARHTTHTTCAHRRSDVLSLSWQGLAAWQAAEQAASSIYNKFPPHEGNISAISSVSPSVIPA